LKQSNLNLPKIITVDLKRVEIDVDRGRKSERKGDRKMMRHRHRKTEEN
jgi:hypothetical protein